MTGNEVVEFVRQRIVDDGGDAGDPRLSATFMLAALNEGAREYYRLSGAGGKMTPINIPTSGILNVPSDFVKPKQIFDADGNEMVFSNLKELVRRQAGSSTGTPSVFTIFGGDFYFAPKPAATYAATMCYYGSAPEITTLAAVIAWPRHCIDAVKEYLIWQAWLALEEPDQAAIAKRLYDEMMSDVESLYDFEEIMFEDLFDDVNHDWRRS